MEDEYGFQEADRIHDERDKESIEQFDEKNLVKDDDNDESLLNFNDQMFTMNNNF